MLKIIFLICQKLLQNEELQEQKLLKVLQNDYKHTGYDTCNNYKINLAIPI
jgi:hypothetical protein